MKVKVELYGKFMGDGNIVDVIKKKECAILLLLTREDKKSGFRCVLNAKEARQLCDQIDHAFKVAEETGFKIE